MSTESTTRFDPGQDDVGRRPSRLRARAPIDAGTEVPIGSDVPDDGATCHGVESVVVAGAGPAGLVAALMFSRLGAQVTVLERAPERDVGAGAGLLLQPNGLAVLEALGLRRRLVGKRLQSAAIRDGHGRVIVEFGIPTFGGDFAHVLAVRRSHLMEVLFDAVDIAPGVEVVHGAKVLDASPLGELRFDVAGKLQERCADLVLGADGIGSKVRSSGDFGARIHTAGRTYLRGIVDGEPDVAAGEYWTPIGLFGCAPLGDGSTYFYADVSAAPMRRAALAGDVASVTDVWKRRIPAVRSLVDAIDPERPVIVGEARRVDCRRFSDGRLVLLGDAAHAMEPTLGQGANSAFVDAAVLADVVRRIGDPHAALVAYDAERRTAVRAVQRGAAQAARVGGIRSTAGRAVRDGLLRATSRPQRLTRTYTASLQVDPVELERMVTATEVSGDRL